MSNICETDAAVNGLSAKHTVFYVCWYLLQLSRLAGPASCMSSRQNSTRKSPLSGANDKSSHRSSG